MHFPLAHVYEMRIENVSSWHFHAYEDDECEATVMALVVIMTDNVRSASFENNDILVTGIWILETWSIDLEVVWCILQEVQVAACASPRKRDAENMMSYRYRVVLLQQHNYKLRYVQAKLFNEVEHHIMIMWPVKFLDAALQGECSPLPVSFWHLQSLQWT